MVKYLTKTEFKTAVGDLARSGGGWGSKVKFYSEKGIKLIDMEPGVIYIKQNERNSPIFMTLTPFSENEDWVGIFDVNNLGIVHKRRLHCSYYTVAISKILPRLNVFGAVQKSSPLTYSDGGDIKANGFFDYSITIYRYNPPTNLEFMNWVSNPLED